MIPRTMTASRTARARKLSAQRKMLRDMEAYIERMAPQWSDGQLVQAMTHVSRQSKMIHRSLEHQEPSEQDHEQSRVTWPPHTGEVGRSCIQVLDLYGLTH